MKLKTFLKISGLMILGGLFVAFIGFDECGTFHQCGQHSLPRYLEYIGLGVAGLGLISLMLALCAGVIISVKNKLK